MKVDVNKVREFAKWLQDIDNTDFSDIEWTNGETPINVSDSFKDHYSETGLQTTDFALLNLYKKKGR